MYVLWTIRKKRDISVKLIRGDTSIKVKCYTDKKSIMIDRGEI